MILTVVVPKESLSLCQLYLVFSHKEISIQVDLLLLIDVYIRLLMFWWHGICFEFKMVVKQDGVNRVNVITTIINYL